RRLHTISKRDWSSDVCSSDLWSTFCRATQRWIALCRRIEAYSRHRCTPLLGVLVPALITVQCYLLYIVLFSAATHLQEAVFAVEIGRASCRDEECIAVCVVFL